MVAQCFPQENIVFHICICIKPFVRVITRSEQSAQASEAGGLSVEERVWEILEKMTTEDNGANYFVVIDDNKTSLQCYNEHTSADNTYDMRTVYSAVS